MDRIEKLKSMLQLSPEDNFIRHALALEYIKIGGDEEAKSLFEAILSGDPQYIGSYYHLAKLYEKMGNGPAAIEWYEKGMAAAQHAGDRHAYNELHAAYETLID